jgi:uncharacterized protein YxeA
MKKAIILLFFIIFSITTQGQVYPTPKYNSRSNPHVELLKITVTDDYTIVEFEHTNPFEGGWATAMPETFIRVSKTKEKLQLLKTSNIPVYPAQHDYKKAGEKLRYKLYFPPINPSTPYIDIIEIEGENKAFNFYKVHLKPVA